MSVWLLSTSNKMELNPDPPPILDPISPNTSSIPHPLSESTLVEKMATTDIGKSATSLFNDFDVLNMDAARDQYQNVHRRKRPRFAIDTMLETAEQLIESNATDLLKTVLQQLVSATKHLTMEIHKLRESHHDLTREVKDLRESKMLLERSRQDATATNPFQPNINAFPQVNMTTNYEAATTKPSYKSVVARNLVGNRRDTIQIVRQHSQLFQNNQSMENVQVEPQEVLNRLTMTLRQPKNHAVIALRYSGMAPRKKVNAKQWREVLKQRNILPHSILFPRYNTLELLIPADQEERTRSFFQNLQRQPENPDPYMRRDGNTETLSTETICRQIQNRLQMLKFERSTVGTQYLSQTIIQGIQLLPDGTAKELQNQLTQMMNEKRMKMTESDGSSHKLTDH